LKSPLLLGNDLRKMSPETLSIINNPAVIAISQDPRGKAIQRVTTNTNVANEDLDMSASLADIFVMDGPGGSAPQVEQTWAVHDLWGHRMSESAAKSVLKQASGKIEGSYNATEIPYAQGLANEDPRLFGEKIGEVKARGQVKARVPRHAAKVFRLRSVDGKDKTRKSLVREEL
jgi:alpha-galactosidase